VWVWTEFIWLSTGNQRRVIANSSDCRVPYTAFKSGQFLVGLSESYFPTNDCPPWNLAMVIWSEWCAVAGLILQQTRVNANQISVVKMEAILISMCESKACVCKQGNKLLELLTEVERRSVPSAISRYGFQRHPCHWPTSLNTQAVNLRSFVKFMLMINYHFYVGYLQPYIRNKSRI
jgi:hypothetical protein